MKKNIIIPIVAALMSVVVAVGAALVIEKTESEKKLPYNAKIFDFQVSLSLTGVLAEDPEFILKAEFLKNNMTYGAWYENENYGKIDDVPENIGKKYLRDKTSPESRKFIITNQEQLDEMYEKCPPVNFEKEMLFVYIITRIDNEGYKIKDVVVENGKASLLLVQNRGTTFTGFARRIIVIKTDKIDITDVEFTIEIVYKRR